MTISGLILDSISTCKSCFFYNHEEEPIHIPYSEFIVDSVQNIQLLPK